VVLVRQVAMAQMLLRLVARGALAAQQVLLVQVVLQAQTGRQVLRVPQGR